MKWLVWAVILVGVVWSFAGGELVRHDSSYPSYVTQGAFSGTEETLQSPPVSGKEKEESEEVFTDLPGTEPDMALARDAQGVINIGEPMDPDDPSTWPQPENTEAINIGEPMDPDDPSTWPQPVNTEVINIGEPMDPDDPSTWPQSENAEVINIGEPMDPDDPYTWPQPENTEVINIGKPMDPDGPSRWDQKP